MARHTPGPWLAGHEDDANAIICGPDIRIGRVETTDVGFDVAAANQRLIAEAPKLLSVLAAIVTACEIEQIRNPTGSYKIIAAVARGAIAKAVGQ